MPLSIAHKPAQQPRSNSLIYMRLREERKAVSEWDATTTRERELKQAALRSIERDVQRLMESKDGVL